MERCRFTKVYPNKLVLMHCLPVVTRQNLATLALATCEKILLLLESKFVFRAATHSKSIHAEPVKNHILTTGTIHERETRARVSASPSCTLNLKFRTFGNTVQASSRKTQLPWTPLTFPTAYPPDIKRTLVHLRDCIRSS